ncbi:hypothetical protein [Luteolibacter sp. AS25]|uniref:hypothetical protein n=1 Tax=Luteolibacter sp. AS25 TaxID=3135776 RepID=UPI00398AC83A
MNLRILSALFLFSVVNGNADVFIDGPALGGSLGGWTKKGGNAAEYTLSGAEYRTYRPEITPTPDGGIFVSIRIDHVRGWLSSDDHAMLEITIDKAGEVVSAQSSIAIQGRSITSDVIRGGTDAGNDAVGVDRALEIGSTLVADVSEKLLREKIVEAGRVSFPSALRHNYNLLYQALRKKNLATAGEEAPKANPLDSPKPEEEAPPKAKVLKIKQYASGDKPDLGAEE